MGGTQYPVRHIHWRENHRLGGIVDRIDQPAHGKGLRVLDYKTGSPANPNFKAVEEIFDSNNIEKHSDYYLQTLLYAVIVANDKQPQSVASGSGAEPALHSQSGREKS